MSVGFSGRKRRRGSHDEFAFSNFNNSPTDNKNSIPSLSDLCVSKIAKLLFHCCPLRLPVKLPTELQEKILHSLAQQNYLNNHTIIPLLSCGLISLNFTNNDSSLRPVHPALIHNCVKVSFLISLFECFLQTSLLLICSFFVPFFHDSTCCFSYSQIRSSKFLHPF